MTSRTITFLTANDGLEPVEGLAGVLVECAPDATWVPRESVSISDLLGPWDGAKKIAAEVVEELLVGEPEIDGVRHLYALKEILIGSATRHQLTLHLDGWLRRQHIDKVVFRAHSHIAESLRTLQRITGAGYTIDTPAAKRRGRLQAAREYLRFKGTSGLSDIPRLAAQQLFPIRSRMLQRRSAGPYNKGDWWYYSTAYTFTNIGLAYERSLGRQFRFVTELRGGAEKPLQERGRDWDELYSYAEKSDAPSEKEIRAARSTLREHLQRADCRDPAAKSLLMGSAELELFFSRLLPLMLLQARVLRRWMDKVDPGLVVVGNEAWEGCLLQQARTRGTPTVILQHGVFGDFYQVTEHSGDVILPRGEFWRDFLSERSRQRSAVLNSESPRATVAEQQGEDLLFVTADYRVQSYWHVEDLADILTAAARAAFESRRRLIVRIHPRESAEPYKNLLARICEHNCIAPVIEYSSGPGLEEAIQKSAVAFLYSSTVFLDCLRFGVPVVCADWHTFSFKETARKHNVFNFACDLADLGRLLADGLAHKLPAPPRYEQFLAPTTKEELRTFFESRAKARTAVR